MIVNKIMKHTFWVPELKHVFFKSLYVFSGKRNTTRSIFKIRRPINLAIIYAREGLLKYVDI